MTTFTRPQVVANSLQGLGSTDDMTHTSVAITTTATMTQGSVLDAAGAEVADVAGAANGVFVIDDLTFHEAGLAVAAVTEVRVASSNNKFITANLQYADGATPTTTALTGLIAKNNLFA